MGDIKILDGNAYQVNLDGNAYQAKMKNIVINREMIRRREMTYDECMEKSMSPVQKDVFIIVDEWWKKYGCSPTLRQIVDVRGKSGIGFSKDSQKT